MRWRKKRNQEIRRQRKEGDSIRGLAHQFGLSRSSIFRILRGFRKKSTGKKKR